MEKGWCHLAMVVKRNGFDGFDATLGRAHSTNEALAQGASRRHNLGKSTLNLDCAVVSVRTPHTFAFCFLNDT